MTAPAPTIDSLDALDIRVGRVLKAGPLEGARKPAYRMAIDLGPRLGTRRSSAQLTDLYTPEDLAGRLVLCVVNLPPRHIAGFESEVLTLGVYSSAGRGDRSGPVTLIVPDGAGDPRPGDRLG